MVLQVGRVLADVHGGEVRRDEGIGGLCKQVKSEPSKQKKLQLTKLLFAFVKRTVGSTGFFPVLLGSINFVRVCGDFALSGSSKKLFLTLIIEKDRRLIVDGESRPVQITQ